MKIHVWLLAYFTRFILGDVIVDKSGFASISYENGKWKVSNELLNFNDNPNVIAIANFTNAQLETGWMFLEVQTQESADDVKQATAAGIAEGYLTRTYIHEYYKEAYANDVCTSDPLACVWLKKRFSENTKFIKKQIKEKAETEPYWHQANLLYQQMDGINEGYKMRTKEENLDDSQMDNEDGVLLLNFIADFWDLKTQYKLLNGDTKNKRKKREVKSRPSCSVLIKHMNEDIFFGHNTWHEYRFMAYRFLKNYKLHYHTLPNQKKLIPGHSMSMSSYAGAMFSVDDFYLMSSGLASTETTLFIYNSSLLADLKAEDTVFEPIRVMISNRLAKTGPQWADLFKDYNSGTYNNQWMVVDYNLLRESPKVLKDGVFTVLEQIPGKIIIEDQTKVLMEKGFWSSYNRAFYPEIFQLSGGQEKLDQYGDWFSHGNTARAKIIARDQHKVQDIPSMSKFMMYNDFKNDPLAEVVGCENPKSTPAGAIANRLDLTDPNQKCVFSDDDWMVGHWGYGCLDAKMATKASFPSLDFTAIAGPTHENFPPFQWSTTNIKGIPKFKPIDKFDFNPLNTSWVTNKGYTIGASLSQVSGILAAAAKFNADRNHF